MDLPLTRIKGGRRGRMGTLRPGALQPVPPPQHPAPGWTWGASQAGWRPTLVGHQQFRHCQSSRRERGCPMEELSLNCHPEWQLSCAHQKGCQSQTLMFPLCFQTTFHAAGEGFLPLPTSPFHPGTLLLARLTSHSLHTPPCPSAPVLTPAGKPAKTRTEDGQNLVPKPLPPSRG